jgi:CheY-like chemotaxis protein
MNSLQAAPEVLLVEDNPTDAEMTLRAFKKHNLSNHVFWVKDGAEALDYLFCRGQYAARLQSDRPKVVLLDLRLPKVDGMDVLKEVKSDERTMFIPVVVLTSSKEERDIETCYKLGANSYICKPVEFDAFMERIADLGMYWVFLNNPPSNH